MELRTATIFLRLTTSYMVNAKSAAEGIEIHKEIKRQQRASFSLGEVL